MNNSFDQILDSTLKVHSNWNAYYSALGCIISYFIKNNMKLLNMLKNKLNDLLSKKYLI